MQKNKKRNSRNKLRTKNTTCKKTDIKCWNEVKVKLLKFIYFLLILFLKFRFHSYCLFIIVLKCVVGLGIKNPAKFWTKIN